MSGLDAALLIAGTAVSAAASIAEGRQASALHRYNMAVAQRDADAARRAAAFDEAQSRRRTQSLMSRQRALFAASGVDTGTGSPLAIFEETAEQGALEALAIRYGGETEALRHESRAELDRMEAKARRRGGYLGAAGAAGGTLLTAARRFDFGGGTGSGLTIPKDGTGFGRIGYSSGRVGGRGMMIGGT